MPTTGKRPMTTASRCNFEQVGRDSMLPRAGTFALVLAAHVALAVWVSHATIGKNEDPPPPRMDVRMIEMAAPRPPEAPKPVSRQAKPLPAAERPAVRRPTPLPPPAVLAAAPATVQAPTSFPIAPQAIAPSKEESAPIAPLAPAPVVPPRFDADYLQNPAPVYPPLSRKLHEEGRVLLFVQVSAKGDAESVELRKSSGFPRLDEAAMSAVRKWRFVPARRGAEPVASSVVVPLVFRLDS